jgi:hypothetical protein
MAYSDIKDPSAYFQTALWTGDGTAGNAVTFDGNSDMQPDFVWSKKRNSATSHVLKDTSRGGTSDNDLHLVSDLTQVESTYAQYRMDFDSDGFTLDGVGDSGFQGSGTSMVSWCWKANGGTTTSFSESGSNPGGTRQTDTTAGFSIISYTGTGSAGTIAHGLPSAPEWIIFKNRDAANVWACYHVSIGNNYKMELHNEAQRDADGAFMNGTLPTSSNITVGASANTNTDGNNYICYAWSPVQGYSKMGTYYGNTSTNGVFNYCGFKPAWVLIKCYTGANDSWIIIDTKRNTFNSMNARLFPDLANAESTSQDIIDCLSNGFKLRTADTAYNGGRDYLWVAFAENPFVAGGIPTTAR